MQDVWEPWVPKVGDRVRLILSPECVCSICGDNLHGDNLHALNGIVGVVEDVIERPYHFRCRTCRADVVAPGHRFGVTALSHYVRGWAAAIELTLALEESYADSGG